MTFTFYAKCEKCPFGMQKRRTRLKKLHRFHFLLFSPTTSKKPSRFTRNFGSQSRRLFTDRDEDEKLRFRSKIVIFHANTTFYNSFNVFFRFLAEIRFRTIMKLPEKK